MNSVAQKPKSSNICHCLHPIDLRLHEVKYHTWTNPNTTLNTLTELARSKRICKPCYIQELDRVLTMIVDHE